MLIKTIISRPAQIVCIVRQYDPGDDNQRQYLTSILKSTAKGRNTIYQVLNDADENIEIFYISLDKLNHKPCLVIKYLFVKPEFRSMDYNDSGVKASAILMGKILEIAKTIHNQIELNYVALQLAHDKLIPTYEALGFEALRIGKEKSWMGIHIDSTYQKLSGNYQK